MSNLDKSADRDGLVRAKSITVFIVSCLRLKSLLGPTYLLDVLNHYTYIPE